MAQTIFRDERELFSGSKRGGCKAQNNYCSTSVDRISSKVSGSVSKSTCVSSLFHELGSKSDITGVDEGAIGDTAATIFIGGADTVSPFPIKKIYPRAKVFTLRRLQRSARLS